MRDVGGLVANHIIGFRLPSAKTQPEYQSYLPKEESLKNFVSKFLLRSGSFSSNYDIISKEVDV